MLNLFNFLLLSFIYSSLNKFDLLKNCKMEGGIFTSEKLIGDNEKHENFPILDFVSVVKFKKNDFEDNQADDFHDINWSFLNNNPSPFNVLRRKFNVLLTTSKKKTNYRFPMKKKIVADLSEALKKYPCWECYLLILDCS